MIPKRLSSTVPAAAMLVMTAIAPLAAAAQTYPTKPARLINPFAPQE